MRFARTAIALLPAFFLLACGGGGGGDDADGGGGTGSTVAAVSITESNARAVSAEAVTSVQDTESTGGGLAAGVQVDAGDGTGATRKLAQSIRLVAAHASSAPELATGVTQTLDCPLGGTLTSTSSIANPELGLSAGDSIGTVANNCRFDDGAGGVGLVINGSFSLTVHRGTLTGMAPFDVSFSISMNNYSVGDGTDTVVFNGDSRFDWVATSDSDQTLTVSGSSLATADGSGVVWKNYSHSVVTQGTSTTYDLDATIETRNASLGGTLVSYRVTTTTPLTVDSSGRLIAGSITIVGAGGSTVVLTVTAPDTFSMQVDTNGDGTYEQTQAVTVVELQSQA